MMFLLTFGLFALFAEGNSEEDGKSDEGSKESINVYVTISNEELKLANAKIEVTDADGDGIITVNDALYLAHEKSFGGGAIAGYATETVSGKLAITKLWGSSAVGAYGCYLNNAEASSLLCELSEGDIVYAFIYTDSYGFTDAYSYFDVANLKISVGGEITLTLKYLVVGSDFGSDFDSDVESDFDSENNVSALSLAGAFITLNGRETTYVTDSDGKVTVKLSEIGTYVISATSNLNLVPPVCTAVAEGNSSASLEGGSSTSSEASDGDGMYGVLMALCAVIVIAVVIVAVMLSGKNQKIANDAVNHAKNEENHANTDPNENE